MSQRIASSRQISDAEATQLSDTNFVLGGWAPQTPPFIRSQPVSRTASAGQDVVFAVGASGVPAPAYQWFKDGAPIPGATGPALLLPAVQASAAGSYAVAVSNSAGLGLSATATLTVVAEAGAPVITQQPQPQTAVIGGGASFTVTATGPPNTNARVSGDFGSNNPTTNAFNNYGGFAAMTYTSLAGFDTPVRLYARTGVSASLLNSTSPFTQFTGAAPTPSTAMVVNTDYRGTLTLQNTGSGVNVSYTLRDAATGNVMMTYSAYCWVMVWATKPRVKMKDLRG